jgi:hypothetical protein
MTIKTKGKVRQKQRKHYGIVNLSIHYTLAAGVAEQLGDDVEGAVIAAVSRIGGDKKQIFVPNSTYRMDYHWHSTRRQSNDDPIVKPEYAISIHLSKDLESDTTISVDWDYF